MKEKEMQTIGALIANLLKSPTEVQKEKTRETIKEMTTRHALL